MNEAPETTEAVDAEFATVAMPSNEAEKTDATNLPAVKARVGVVDRIMPIACTSIEEAYRTADMLCLAGMVPKAYVVQPVKNGPIDWKATKSRMTVAIMSGSEVGWGPVSSIKNIYIVNGMPSVYGQGAKALVQRSGAVEWEKVETKGTWAAGDIEVTVSLKRRGQSEPYVRTFSKKDATKAGIGGRGVWKIYPERMLYWRAWTWAARDGFSDALMGLSLAEELEDMSVIEAKRLPTDTSDLDETTTKGAEDVKVS